jgi:hypothetical protein
VGLYELLRKLEVTEVELQVLCGALMIEFTEITAETSEGTVLRLVEIAVERDMGQVLESRIRAIAKTRAKATRPAHLYDASRPRAMGGSL